ncbi:MAG: hypothetical protein WA162_09140 [Thermodesulfobacteriota bacterium]
MKKTTLLFMAILAILTVACSTAKTSNHAVFQLTNSPATAVYEKDSIKIAIYSAVGADIAGNALLEKLLSRGYILLRMDIENKSTKKLAFNPAMSHLLAGAMDYKKPLDYPDLYQMLSTSDSSATPDAELRSIKGRFYDTNTVLKAGEKTSKLLIFLPLDPGSKNAMFTMHELYVGTEVVTVAFPFVVKKK